MLIYKMNFIFLGYQYYFFIVHGFAELQLNHFYTLQRMV